MSTLRRRILVAASLVSLLLATLEIGTPVAAAPNITYQLYGTRNSGWGFTNTSLTTPGPPMEVVVGDNLTLNLTSLDGRNHNWYIDYNNNSVVDANETGSSSPTFRTGARLWNFTVSNRTGTFPYRSRFNGDGNMWGNITVLGSRGEPALGNLVLIGGVVIVLVGVLAIAALAYRRRRVPPAPPPE